MSYKPGDFFLGVIDFFGILVPGCLLVWQVHPRLLSSDVPATQWIFFIVLAYIAGHLILAAGMPLDRLHDRFWPVENDHNYQAIADQIELPKGVKRTRKALFYRAFSFVRLHGPGAIGEIERLAAEYKLFRGLTLVCVASLPRVVYGYSLVGSLTLVLAGVLLILAVVVFLWRYLYLYHWTQQLTFDFYALIKEEQGRVTKPVM